VHSKAPATQALTSWLVVGANEGATLTEPWENGKEITLAPALRTAPARAASPAGRARVASATIPRI